jgi:DNA-directed RNA polymerase specialized sigma24 family protein
MREPRHKSPKEPDEYLPPFWIFAKDSRGRPLDPRVKDVAEQLWRLAYRLVDAELHDAASAAQIVEKVASEVSSRLREQPGINGNLRGYFMTAFRRRVRHQSMKENRVAYEGLVSELELNHHLTGPDFKQIIEQRLCLAVVADLLPHEARHMLHLRMLEFSWEEIGRRLRITAKQARSRFYYELEKVHAKLCQNRPEDAGFNEESD